MSADIIESRIRRAYELGRMRVATIHAGTASILLAAIALIAVGHGSLNRLPLAFAAAWFADWRGGDTSRGAWRGILIGAASLALPLWVLRPCCTPGMEMDASCCQPGYCLAAGGLIGLAAAMFLPKLDGPRRWEATAAMSATVIAVASMRCAPLFWGESAGLLGGIAAGTLATSAARQWWDRRAASTG